MFTGIITHLGALTAIDGETYTFSCPRDLAETLRNGDSIAVNGTCLTVTGTTADSFHAVLSPETLSRTTLGTLTPGQAVNLERPLLANGRLDGHIVQGHVDGVATITEINPDGGSFVITISLPPDLARYSVEKGSITVNGISLTIASLTDTDFSVAIIPHTWEHTMLHTAAPGTKVNLEVDVIAKYVEKLTKPYVA